MFKFLSVLPSMNSLERQICFIRRTIYTFNLKNCHNLGYSDMIIKTHFYPFICSHYAVLLRSPANEENRPARAPVSCSFEERKTTREELYDT